MKNIYRLGFLLLFLGIGFYMIVNCFGLTVWGNCLSILEMMHPTANNSYMDPFFSLCVFTPAIVLILSFFWKSPFSNLQRAFLVLLTISAGWMGVFNLLTVVCFNCNIAIHYLVIQVWNFGTLLWIFSLTIVPQWTVVNWPFDKKQK